MRPQWQYKDYKRGGGGGPSGMKTDNLKVWIREAT